MIKELSNNNFKSIIARQTLQIENTLNECSFKYDTDKRPFFEKYKISLYFDLSTIETNLLDFFVKKSMY